MTKKSTFSVLFFLRTDQPKKTGEVGIHVRITINSKSTSFSTKQYVHPSNWNKDIGKAVVNKRRTNMDTVTRINRSLDTLNLKIQKIYDRLFDEREFFTPDDIKKEIFGEDKRKTLFYYCDSYIEINNKKVGKTLTRPTFRRYGLCKERVQEFLKKEYNKDDLYMNETNLVFIEEFYFYLIDVHDVSHNTALKFLQRLRTMFLHAKKLGEVFNDPFDTYQFRFDIVDRHFLKLDEINRLVQQRFSTKRLSQVRDMFVFSCYTGLSYIDLHNLSLSKIKRSFDGSLWIMLKREKTNVDSNIKLMDVPRCILEKYLGRKLNEMDLNSQSEERILPVISNQKMNEYLGEISVLCNINSKLTFHIARHTFATLCLTMGTPIESVSKMLGHTSIATTQIYAKVIDTKLSSDMNNLERALKEQKIVNTYK